MTSVRDEPMQVAVESAGIRVVTTSTQGPAGPATVAAGSVITTANTMIVGDGTGTPVSVPTVVHVDAYVSSNPATDATAGITAAYAICPTGGTLRFSSRVYLMKTLTTYHAALAVAKSLRIEGEPGTIIRADAASSDGIRLLEIKADDVTVEGITFDINGINAGTCNYLKDCANVTIDNCRTLDAGSGLVLLDGGTTDVTVTQNHVVSNGGYGLLANDVAGIARITVTNNSFDLQGGAGDAIEFNGITQIMYDIVVTGNTIYNCGSISPETGFGIGIARCVRFVVSNNTINTCGRNGVHVENQSAQGMVSLNTIANCDHAGIEVQGESGITCEAVTITHNQVSDCCLVPSINLGNGGIDLGSSTGAPFTGFGAKALIVTNNIITHCQGAGIYAFEVSKSLIKDNIIRNTYGLSTDTTTAIQNVGLYAISFTYGRIVGNIFSDSQGVPTQYYPMYFYGSVTGQMRSDNLYIGLGSIAAGSGDATSGSPANLEEAVGTASIRVDGGFNKLAFYGATPIVKPTGVAVSAAGVHAALVSLGIISA